MKKFYISVACILAALVSCQKSDAPVQNPEDNHPVKVTLTATIGGDDTKVTFVDDENVLKTAWEADDQVSLIALDESGKVLSNDVFTASEAGESADFEGTFSNYPSTSSVYVYYPALTDGEGTAGKPWQVKPSTTGSTYGTIYGLIKGQTTLQFDGEVHLQKGAADCSHLSNYMILGGKAEMAGDKFEVDLAYQSYVLKVEITLPKAGLTIYNLQLNTKYTDYPGNNFPVSAGGYIPVNDFQSSPDRSNGYYLYFGDDYEDYDGTGIKLDSDKLTAYFVAYSRSTYHYYEGQTSKWFSWNAGNKIDFQASVKETVDEVDEYYDCVLNDYVITKTTTLENGKMYRLSAILAKQL